MCSQKSFGTEGTYSKVKARCGIDQNNRIKEGKWSRSVLGLVAKFFVTKGKAKRGRSWLVNISYVSKLSSTSYIERNSADSVTPNQFCTEMIWWLLSANRLIYNRHYKAKTFQVNQFSACLIVLVSIKFG